MTAEESQWSAWHAQYDDADSALSRRLAVVQRAVRAAIPATPADFKIVSICARHGRDVLDVLAERDTNSEIRARLVELDPSSAAEARRRAAAAGLDCVEVVEGDAADLTAYGGMAPADLILACGIFGNISDEDIFECISCLPQLCAPSATVIWTRHRRPPDLTPAIRGTFEDLGFEELDFTGPDDAFFGVGVSRYVGGRVPLEPGRKMFTFLV